MEDQRSLTEKRPVFPPAILEDTRYAHFSKYASASRVLYAFVIFIFFLGFIGLFIIRVPVQVQAQGELLAQDSASELHPQEFTLRLYVQPADLGLIETGMLVSAGIDGYDHNIWGSVQGSVIRKYQEAVMTPTGPVFPVDARLESRYLELKNGYRGQLIAGMRVQAGLPLAERRLFEWILDKPDSQYTFSSETSTPE